MKADQVSPIKSIHDLTEAATAAQKQFKSTPWYRGHAVATWKLLPSAMRDRPPEFEQLISTAFRNRAPARYPACPTTNDYDGWLTLMQHHGAPTRLLDWTESILMAAYFAVAHKPNEGKDDDAVVWAMSPRLLNKKGGLKGVLDTDSVLVQKLFMGAFDRTQGSRMTIAVRPRETHIRMMIQSSGFTVHGSTSALDGKETFKNCLMKFIVPAEYREGLGKQLFAVGIRRSLLFPDLDHLAEELVAIASDEQSELLPEQAAQESEIISAGQRNNRTYLGLDLSKHITSSRHAIRRDY